MSDYIQELNEGQRAAVLYNDGPSLVIAGAGSGKTRVLTYKIAYLIREKKYDARNILALTFTNKAAKEIIERVNRDIGYPWSYYIWMGTFHSIFSRILRREANILGFTRNYTIYDTTDSRSLIHSIIKELGLNDKQYKPSTVLSRISNAKNYLNTPVDYAKNKEAYESDCLAKMPAIRDIYVRYWERCRQADAMDFDDLLFYTFLLFHNHPEVLARYQELFRYVLVDEYQDTNYAQHCILCQLMKDREKQHICVVGDDAQSIYSFRGADIDNILNFTKVYPDTKVFKLEQNYRSTQTIVSAANSLIEKNQRRIRKEVFSEKDKGEPIGVYQAYSDVEEGDIVINKIAELRRQENYAYSDFAILYRTNAQSRVFEEAMRKRSMPYRIYGGLSFYQRKEIKDVIAYFRLTVNPNDEEAFKRIINYPARGMIAGFIESVAEKNAYELGTEIIRQSGIIADVCQDNSPENLSRKENIEELANGMSDFCAQRLEEGNANTTLSDFLSEVSLPTDQDSDKDGDDEKITLMTVHSAKGLEFKNVFVVGMEENLFPSGMAGDSPRALEEERRLFYVAITRAEDHCFLTYAKSRYRYGKMEFGNPSRFLKDIDVRFLKLPQDAGLVRKVDEHAASFRRENRENFVSAMYGKRDGGARPRQEIIAPTVPRNLKRVTPSMGTASAASHSSAGGNAVLPGQFIEHERFGLGEVLKVEGEGDNAKATIHFKNAGDKQLLLRFARFKVIG